MAKIFNFPTFPISKQLFYVPGAAIDGGFTSGGASILSPEPGGRSRLDLQPSWQIQEWEYPLSSWIMSKTNGQVLRVRLAPTPQIASARVAPVNWQPDDPWSNNQPWAGDLTASYAAEALEGSNVLVFDASAVGPVLKPGHVIGHSDYTYLVDEISYGSDGKATVIVTPPIRRKVNAGDQVFFRPYFLGTISNPDGVRATYDAENAGHIQPGLITFNEAVL